MKKKIAIILASVMLAGCAQPSKNAKDRNSSQAELSSSLQSREQSESIADSKAEKREVNKTVSEKDLEKCVQGSTAIILAGKYDNLKIDSNFKVSAGAYPQVIEALVPSDFDKNAAPLLSFYFKDENYSASKLVTHYDKDSGTTSAEFSGEKHRGFVNADGSVAMIENDYMNNALYGTSIPVSETKNLILPVTDDKISLGDESIDLRDIEKSAADLLDLYLPYACEGTKYSPYSVSTVAQQNGELIAFLRCRQIISGVPVFDLHPRSAEMLQMPYLSAPIVTFNSKGRAVQMNIGQKLDVKQKTKPEQILTPEYAFETASKALAPHIDHTARFEELVLVPTVANSERSHQQLKAGDNVTLKPYWVIHFETDWWKEVYAAVDAVTGEVYYVNNRS